MSIQTVKYCLGSISDMLDLLGIARYWIGSEIFLFQIPEGVCSNIVWPGEAEVQQLCRISASAWKSEPTQEALNVKQSPSNDL